MEKYLHLTPQEAIRYFIQNNYTPTGETEILPRFRGDISVSIVMPTHRSKPGYDQDPIVMKNYMDEVEKRLFSLYDKRLAQTVVDNIKNARKKIDFGNNLDSLVLYANEHFSTVIKLPVEVKGEVMIGYDFDLRPLYKTNQQDRRYYILTVSLKKIRLIEAFNDKPVREVLSGDFPFIRDAFYETADKEKIMQDDFVEDLYKEFCNDADKSFQQYYKEEPLPVILAGDVKSVAYYELQMDNKNIVIGRVAGSYDNVPAHAVVTAVLPELERYRKSKETEYLSEIDYSASSGLLVTDVTEMFSLAEIGQAGSLYIGNGFSVNGIEEKGNLKIIDKDNQELQLHDILHLLIWNVNRNKGKVIFMDDILLEKYGGAVMIKRY